MAKIIMIIDSNKLEKIYWHACAELNSGHTKNDLDYAREICESNEEIVLHQYLQMAYLSGVRDGLLHSD